MSITIKKLSESSMNALYCKYESQTDAQGCYIELDCENEILRATYNAEIGNAVPFSVHHGHDQRFGIPCLTAKAANNLMEEISPLAERVIAGYRSHWDGQNHVALFDGSASIALEEITELCENIEPDEYNTVQACSAGDWLEGSVHRTDAEGKSCRFCDAVKTEIDDIGTITGETTDEQLAAMETKIEGLLDENQVLDDLAKWLKAERDNLQ